MRLAQDGKIDLDAPLATYLPGIEVDANGATVRQALAMKSGIPDTGSTDAVRADCSRVWDQTEIVAVMPKPNMAPGTAYVYSNPTYKLLGYAIETASGQSFADALGSMAFQPLGITGVFVQTADHPTPKPWALPIAGHSGGLALEKFGLGDSLPCDSLTSFSFTSAVAANPLDLANWGYGLFEGKVIDQAHLMEMATLDGGGHGLGLDKLFEFSPDFALGHTGHQSGYASWLVILPERQTVVVCLINDENGDIDTGVRRLIKALG
jgi:D-alanyl-D-alanine carboxypeptidase